MVPADVLGKLPNLQYFASVSGGRIIKGRFPILDPDPPSSSDAPAATAEAIR
jgi:conjugal transfer pilus assembly protein TraD